VKPLKIEVVLLKAIFNIKEKLNLTDSQLSAIIGIGKSTFYRWVKKGEVSLRRKAVREALGHFIAKYASLEAGFSDDTNKQAWLTTIHPEIGMTPLDKMLNSITQNNPHDETVWGVFGEEQL
jgi:hypothetical protein